MATIGNLVTRVRAVLDEATGRFWTDAILVELVASGLQATHQRVKSGLRSKPPQTSPYWLSLRDKETITVAGGSQEIALPTDLDILVAIMDSVTNEELSPYSIEEEKMLQNGNVLGVSRGQGFYTFVASKKIRVLVYPGQEGVPIVNRALDVHFYQIMPRYTALGDTVVIPDEHTQPSVDFAIANGLAREREDPTQYYTMHIKGAEAIQ